jgi:hypothetical protein
MYYSLSCKIRFEALKERSRWRDDKYDAKLIYIHILPQRETIQIVMDDESVLAQIKYAPSILI